MFQSARLKLTFWYILIIAIISILFSIAFYKASTQEFDRIRRIHTFRIEHPNDFPTQPFRLFIQRSEPNLVDPRFIDNAEQRITLSLIVINLAILIISSLAAYFLAGRTLKPIQEMVDEQNRFITDSSHELRTPLTSLKTEIEVSLRDKKLKLENVKKLLESNLEEVNNLKLLSDNLIKLTQYNKANGNLIFEKVALTQIMDEAIKKVTSLAKHKKIIIKNNIDKYNLKADKQSLTEVFVILLDNAIKYSPTKSTIKLTTEKIDHSILIKFIDQGIGIAPEDIPHLFDRFYRADKSRTKKDYPGYGLGLAIAKKIIDEHKGIIRVSSEVGKGTAFNILLPLG